MERRFFRLGIDVDVARRWYLGEPTRITGQDIDDKVSAEVQLYSAEDGRPVRIGEYRSVIGLCIDTSKVGDAHVFRPWEWPPPVIVGEEIKEALERTGMVGGQFDEV